MEQVSGAAASVDGLRHLGAARPVEVLLGEQATPAAVVRRTRVGRQSVRIAQIDEVWKLDDEWWRDRPQRRTYYRLVAEDGRKLTLFHDDTEQSGEVGWYEHV